MRFFDTPEKLYTFQARAEGSPEEIRAQVLKMLDEAYPPPKPKPIAELKPVPTQEEIDRRHRTSVAQALANVQRAVEALEKTGSKNMVETQLYYAGAYDKPNGNKTDDNVLVNHLRKQATPSGWDKALPIPTIKVTWLDQIVIESGPFKALYKVPPNVRAFLYSHALHV